MAGELWAVNPVSLRADWLTPPTDDGGDDSIEQLPGRINIRGPLGSWFGTDYEDIRAALGAMVDGGAKLVILDIDSPGGTVAGVFETIAAIEAAREKATVIAYVSGTAASAAYWLAAACDEIVTAPTAMLGCVGAVVSIIDWSKAATDAGVMRYRYTSARTPGKAPDPGTEASAAELQAIVDAAGDAFLADLGRLRKIRGGLDTVAEAYQFGATLAAPAATSAGWADRMISTSADDRWISTGAGPVPLRYTLPPMRPGAARSLPPVAMGGHMADTVTALAALAALGITAQDAGDGRLVLSTDETARLVGHFQSTAAQVDALKVACEASKAAAEAATAKLVALESAAADRAIGDLVDSHIKRGAIAPGQRDQWIAQAKAMGATVAASTLALLPVSAPMAPVADGGKVETPAAESVDFSAINAAALKLAKSEGISFDAALGKVTNGKFGNWGVTAPNQEV